ncbi:MAG TPA: hypothetical protein PLJ34_05580 [Hyphomicrobiales bacterium]|nr:hypothetical protein [Hyphomicrobiales bacterium]
MDPSKGAQSFSRWSHDPAQNPHSRLVCTLRWNFLPDLEDDYEDIYEALPDMVTAFLPHEQGELREFFVLLLEDDYSDATLKGAWDVCGPTWNFSLGGHRRFFRTALAEVEKAIAERREG